MLSNNNHKSDASPKFTVLYHKLITVYGKTNRIVLLGVAKHQQNSCGTIIKFNIKLLIEIVMLVTSKQQFLFLNKLLSEETLQERTYICDSSTINH